MTIKHSYESALAAGSVERDEAQRQVVERLGDLQQRIMQQSTAAARLRRRLFGQRKRPGVKGVYLWGGVGRGKTFLMDLFFSTLAVQRKRRVHFHRLMHDVHARRRRLVDVEDPLEIIAADIAAETVVLCFDEFYVSDIGDAMLLGKLLDGLFRRGVTLVATSNTPPQDLYKGGLQRERFQGAIEAIKRNVDVIELSGDVDYRLQLLETAGTFLSPADASADDRLLHFFNDVASGAVRENEGIDILGRNIRARRSSDGIAWFDFADLCEGPRSQEDYIELARDYPTVILSNVPVLAASDDNAARRFIALVDEFYERKVKLLISAEADIDSLYKGERLAFEFRRTASRLAEMQSREYLHAAHLA